MFIQTVSGATVVITDITANLTDVLTENAPGDYVTHTITGIDGHSYQMKVMLDGKRIFLYLQCLNWLN